MSYANLRNKVSAYNQVGVQSEVLDASPHRVIQMLMSGALDKIAIAKGALERDELNAVGSNISWAISIIDGLRMSLDKSLDNDIVNNLDSLYEYMNTTLLEANIQKDVQKLDEVGKLLSEIKAGWDAIANHPEAVAAQQQLARD